MDGLELLRRISESNLSLPVIVMTGHGEGSLAAQAVGAGAIDCIEKPFRADVLLDAVFSVLQVGEAP
jgi:two-component system, LuxR family, response regulator FixJ